MRWEVIYELGGGAYWRAVIRAWDKETAQLRGQEAFARFNTVRKPIGKMIVREVWR